MSDQAPPAKGDEDSRKEDSGNQIHVNQLACHADDIGESRRLAEQDPELARKMVDNREAEHRREENGCRPALFVAGVIAVAMAFGGVFVLAGFGWLQAIMFVLVLLGTSHLARAVLAGKFPDASWFGKFLIGARGKDEEWRPLRPELARLVLVLAGFPPAGQRDSKMVFR